MGKPTTLRVFWANADLNGPIKRPDLGPCWVWTGATNRAGYAHHRWFWEQVNGPVPEGLELDHLCRNPPCFRPDHLEPVTHRENIIRSPITPMGINARKTECDRGHPLSGDNLKIRPCGRRECRKCARLRQARFQARKRARQQALPAS